MLYKNVVVPVCVSFAFELSILLYFTFRLNSPQLARQPVAHILDSAGCHSSDYALIQLTSTQPSSSRSDMTPKGVFVSYLKARSNHLATQKLNCSVV